MRGFPRLLINGEFVAANLWQFEIIAWAIIVKQ